MYYIKKITSHPTVDFAAEELKKYMRMMMPRAGEIEISFAPNADDGFRLGLMTDFGLDTSEAEDVTLDDIIHIDTNKDGGIIAGSNARSVLLAVYRYLRENGCRWLFPGIDGEVIPIKDIEAVSYHKMADCRYRGQCNEGGEYQPNMIEAIDFTPKIGMNVFMMEFLCPHVYYDLYYNHTFNEKNREAEPVTYDTVIQWKKQCEAEIAKRGLQFHDMGHGWASIPFGLDPDKRYAVGETDDALEGARPYLALVNGERKLESRCGMYTNFCMSQPENREKVVKCVADYSEASSNIDYLHIWLGDSVNRCCECDDCYTKTNSDWYVILLNEIDAELTARGLDTRIVCICYYDTLCAPETEKLNNPDRFSLLVAPITRRYTEPVSPEPVNMKLPKYVRNKIVNPTDPREPVAYAQDWSRKLGLRVLVYEYHFWVNQFYEPTGIRFAEIIHNDIKGYRAQNFDGTIEDGSQRSFFPNGFAFYTYGHTLFDTSIDFEELKEDYFSHAYGEDWKEVTDFLYKLGELMDHKYLAGERSADEKVGAYYNPSMAEKLRRVPELTAAFAPFVEAHKNMPLRAQTVAYRMLRRYLEFADGYAGYMVLKSFGAAKEARAAYNRFLEDFGKYEIEMERWYDQGNFGKAMRWRTMKKDEEPINMGV